MVQTLGFNQLWLLVEAFRWTILLSVIAFICGSAGGLVIALIRTSPFSPLRILGATFIIVFQGTPLLMQLFVIYYALPLLHIEVNAWVAVSIGLTLHASAYLGEIWRGTIIAVPRGQDEAAKALGLKYRTRMFSIILPQAFRISVPSTVGFMVQLIKGTSLASIIGFTELTRAGQIVSNATFQPLIVFAIVGAMYFALCWPLSQYSFHMEKRFAVSR